MRKLLSICCTVALAVLCLSPLALVHVKGYAGFTASVSGNTNDPVTWGFGAGSCVFGTTCPGSGDTAQINDGVILTNPLGVTFTIGTSPASAGTTALKCASAGGTGVFINNGTLRMQGPVVSGCSVGWVWGPGSAIDHDSSLSSSPSTTHYQWIGFLTTANGGAGSPVTVSNHAGGGYFGGMSYDTSGGKFAGTYVNFTGCGGTFCSALSTTDAGNIWSCDHCTWTDSGPVMYMQNAIGATSTVSLTNSNFTSPSALNGKVIDLSLVDDGIGFTISHNYLVGTLAYYLGVHQSHLDLSDNIIWGALNGGSEGIPMTRTMIYSDAPTSGGAQHGVPGTGAFAWTDNYFVRGCRAGVCTNNPHWFDMDGLVPSDAEINGAVIDCETALTQSACSGAGDAFQITNNPATLRTLTLKNILALWNPATGQGVGTIVNQSHSVGPVTYNNLHLQLEHITYVGSPAGGDCEGLSCVENNGGAPTQTAGTIQYLKNSIIWGTTGFGEAVWMNNSNGVVNSGAYVGVDYNGHFGVFANPYVGSGTYPGRIAAAGFATPSTPGTHDVTSDPAFLDSTRNLLKFCQLHDITITTYSDCVLKFATLNDASPVAWAVVPDLTTYVRTGFTPTNSAYFTAGDDGSTLGAVPASGTVITDIKVLPTQIRIEYTTPDSNPCKFEASRSASYSPLVSDVDATLFSGSNLDTRAGAWTDPASATHRVFIVGTRDIQAALNGRDVSRALQNLTLHYIRASCGSGFSDVATTTATTAYPIYGRSTRDPWILDANGFAKWPTVDYNDRAWETVDPFTGTLVKNFSLPSDVRRVFTGEVLNACSVTTGWSGCGILSAGDSTYAGTTQQPLAIRMPPYPFAIPYVTTYQEYESIITSWNWIVAHAVGFYSGSDLMTADRATDFAISFDGTLTPTSGTWVTATLPTSSGTTDIGARTVGSLLGANLRFSSYQSWATGFLYNSGSSTTVNFTKKADCDLLIAGQDAVTISNAAGVPLDYQTVSKNCGATPPSMVISSALNLDPSSYIGAAGWPFQYYSGFEYNPRLTLLIRKHSTTASNTLHLTGFTFDSQHGGSVGNTSGGFSEFGSQFLDGNSCYKTRFVSNVLSYCPNNGTVAYLGQAMGFTSGGVISAGSLCISSGYQFWLDANTFYCVGTSNATGKEVVFRGVLSGNAANDVDNQPTGNNSQVGPDVITWTAMSGDLEAAAKTFDSTFDDANYSEILSFAFSGGRYVIYQIAYNGGGTQDALSYIAVYDLGNGLPIGSGGDGQVVALWNTAMGPSSSAWSVFHTGLMMAPLQNGFGVNFAVGEGKPGKNEYAGNPLYSFSYAGQYWNGSTFVTADMPNTCDPCRIKMSGTPTAPVAPTTLKEVGVGEVIMLSGGGNKEFVQVTAVTTPSTDITISRHFDPSTDFPARTWPSGTFGYMQPYWGFTQHLDENGNLDAYRWDFLTYPHGPPNSGIYASALPGGGHSIEYNKMTAGAPCLSGVVTPTGVFADRSGFPFLGGVNTTFSQPCDLPYFSGSKYAPQYGNICEGHPSYKPAPWSILVDSCPMVSPAPDMNNLEWVSGTKFKLTYREVASTDAVADGLSRKWHPSHVAGSRRIYQDISGPSSSLPDDATGHLKYCVVLVAGECSAGSMPDDIYVNDPHIIPNKYNVSDHSECVANGGTMGDTCFADFAPRSAAISGYQIPTNQTNQYENIGFFQILEQVGMCSRPCKPNTDNTQELWGSYTHYGYAAQTEGQLITNVLIKLPETEPPYTEDNSVFGGLSIAVSSPPATTDNVVVEFGYAEYGATTAYQCTSRLELCVANSSTLSQSSPFLYPSEGSGNVLAGITGVSCASTCTVVVPVIPGYTVYPKLIYRNSSNAIIGSLVLPPDEGTQPTGGAPHIMTSCPLPAGTQGTPYSYSVSVTGDPVIVVTKASGSFPTGVSMDTSGNFTGTPSAAGTFNFTLLASNGVSPDATLPTMGNCSIVISSSTPTSGRIIGGKATIAGKVSF